MRGDPEEIIIGLLKDSPKTSSELVNACKAEGLKGKTYYRARDRLVNSGKIKNAKFILVQEEEANSSEVEYVIQKLKTTDNKELLIVISEELIRLTDRKRSATAPNFLEFLKTAILNPKFSDSRILSNIIQALRLMLNFELKRHKPDEHIIERLIDISRIKKALESYSERHVLGEALLFLSLTESKESVEIIFKFLRKLNGKDYHEVESAFEMALFGVDSRLYDKQHVGINDKVYELIADENPILRERGVKLHKRKMRHRR